MSKVPTLDGVPLYFSRGIKRARRDAGLASALCRNLKRITRDSKELEPTHLLMQLLLLKPHGCSEAYDFKWQYLANEAMSKWPEGENVVPPEERKFLAIEKLLANNAACKRVNEEGFAVHSKLDSVLHLAAMYISKLLYIEDNPEAELYGKLSRCSLPGGATTSHSYRQRALCEKYTIADDGGRDWTVTQRARPYWEAQKYCNPWLSRFLTKSHLGNEVFTVDKNSDIDRAACKESIINANLQRGVGAFLRRKLKKVGIDLNDQSNNQRLARIGSIRGCYATIDLSSASDLISDRLVFSLLPDWLYKVCDDLRSHYGKVPTRDGSHHAVRWSLFSTMGNGFTFELETLIFWALAKACKSVTGSKGSVIVYGDDIICPSNSAPLLLEILKSVGCKPNEKKSFINGPFRESCGKHYYKGVDVTPFYFRKRIDSIHRVHWFLNRIREWASDDGICDPSVQPLWLYIRRKYTLSEFSTRVNSEDLSTYFDPTGRGDLQCVPSFAKIKYTGYGPLFKWYQYTDEIVLSKYGVQEEDLGSCSLGQDFDRPILRIAKQQSGYDRAVTASLSMFPSEIERFWLSDPLNSESAT